MFSVLSMQWWISLIELTDVKKCTCISATGPDIDTQALSKYSFSVGICPRWYHWASNRYDLHRSAHCEVNFLSKKLWIDLLIMFVITNGTKFYTHISKEVDVLLLSLSMEEWGILCLPKFHVWYHLSSCKVQRNISSYNLGVVQSPLYPIYEIKKKRSCLI